MSHPRSSIRHWSSSLCVAGLLLAGVPALTWAQSNPGFTFSWGDRGPSGKQQLGYVLEYGTPGHMQDRWRLKVKQQTLAVDSIKISYPDYFDGEFNEKQITLQDPPKSKFLGFGKVATIPVSSVKVDKDNRLIEIIPEAPIPSGKAFEIVLSDVENPRSGGMYYFNCSITSPGDLPLSRYVGTWVLSIFRS
ncbi:MAG: DUF2808 domain-containing protein [Thermosynechococcaceae cyanobacterium]